MLQDFNIHSLELLDMRNWAGNLGIADSMNGTAFPDFDHTEKNQGY